MEVRDPEDPIAADHEGRPRTERRRIARIAFLFICALGLIALARTWHGRAIDVEIVHRVDGGDVFLPADVEIQVWQDDVLHADAYFPRPDSLEELDHSIRVPRGRYRIVYSVIHELGEPEVRFEQTMVVHDPGRYFLSYRIPD
jgi:hypothetical protein